MKKFILPLIAIAAFASCSKDNIIDENRQVIRFDAPFINNATKAIDPSYSDANPINEFQVWGTVKGNSNTAVGLFATNGYGATVTRPVSSQGNPAPNGSPFTCSETEYWLPSATYNFYAIAGAKSVEAPDGVPTEIFYLADGVTDLVYATSETITTDEAAVPQNGLNDRKCVPFSFTHLLAKVKFTFNNAFPVGSGIALCVKDIQINNAYSENTYKNNKWEVSSFNDAIVKFGHGATVDATTELPKPEEALIFVPQGTPAPEAGENEGETEATVHTSAGSNFERLLIPAEQNWNISFTVEYLKKDIKDTYVVMHSEKKESTVKAHFQAGYSYNLVANIENQFTPITFTVDENGVYGFGTGTVTDDDFLNE